MDTLLAALRHALRRLVHRPGVTAAVVVILALGIGVSTAVFSGVRESSCGRPPVADLDRLVVAWETDRRPPSPVREPRRRSDAGFSR